MREAERENDGFSQGQPVAPPMPWHNHPLHMIRHRRFFMSDKFRALPPHLQGAAMEHAMLHQEFIDQAMMQLKPGQAAPGGNKPGAAGGSKGTAKGDQAGTDKEMAQDEAQGASPDTFSGGQGPQ